MLMPRLRNIGGVDAVVRLRGSIDHAGRRYAGVPVPTDAQVAMVLHALADHTAIQLALHFDRDWVAGQDSSPWPEATSVGRFLHALGDRFDEEAAAE